MREKFSLRT